MRIFIKKILLFLLSTILVVIGSYALVDMYIHNIKGDDAIFIWGDSQTLQGIELSILKEKTNKKIYTSAIHGAGIYNFLVFAEKVPANSEVIIQLSKPAQIREKEFDNNKSGISLNAIKVLMRNNYSISEILSILKKNRKPENIFMNRTQMNPITDSIVLREPISLFKNLYAEIPEYLESKQQIILTGIKKLKNKNCIISFVEFPYHPILKEIENKSPIKSKTDKFKHEVLKIFNVSKIDTIHLRNDKQLMYDLTHLNILGASEVSTKIAEKNLTQEIPTLYIITWR